MGFQKRKKHSKYRNTGILFELLTRQVTADIIGGNAESDAQSILFKYFRENTDLGKEWQLYNFLLNSNLKTESKAERFLSVVLEQRKRLNDRRLTEQKYSLVKEIKDKYTDPSELSDYMRKYASDKMDWKHKMNQYLQFCKQLAAGQ